MTDLQKQLAACLICRAVLDNAGFPSAMAEEITDFWDKVAANPSSAEALRDAIEALKACERFCAYNKMRFTDEDVLNRLMNSYITFVEVL